MEHSDQQSAERSHEDLREQFDGRLRVIAKQAETYWSDRSQLDNLLAQYVGVLEGCELLYAIDRAGQQVSSNIRPGEIDADSFGQDLSGRPYSESLSLLKDVAFRGAFACEEYLSRETQRTCVTVMYGVRSSGSLLGFIAADFYPTRT